jgi:glutamine synthetase
MFDRTPKGLVPRKRTPKQVLSEIKDKDVKFIDLQFMDVPGRTQHVSITSTMLEEDTFDEGVAKLDGSSIKGFAEIYESDMLLMPDPSTYALIPWGD